MRERDLKRILAWSTVSALGTMTLLTGLPNDLDALAFVAFVCAHALYKAALFFIVGNVDHAVGTRVMDHLRGLRAAMPWTATAAVPAGLSMAGLPSTIGFIAKDIVKVAKELSGAAWFVGGPGLLVSAVSVAVASVVAGRTFFGRASQPLPDRTSTEPIRLVLPALGIARAGIVLGLFPSLIAATLYEAARIIAPRLDRSDASLETQWLLRAEGWLLVLALGAAIYAGWNPLHRFIEHLRFLDRVGPASAYAWSVGSIRRIAGIVSRNLQSGRLGRYVAMALFTSLMTKIAVYAVLRMSAEIFPTGMRTLSTGIRQ